LQSHTSLSEHATKSLFAAYCTRSLFVAPSKFIKTMVDPEDPPALEGVDPEDIDDWLTANVDAGELSVLKKNTDSNSEAWQFFCRVIKQKDDIDEQKLPKKWTEQDLAKGLRFAAYNKCGSILVSIGRKNSARAFRGSVAGMNTHLESGKGHITTAKDLSSKVKRKHKIATDSNQEHAKMIAQEHAASQNDGAQLAAGVGSVHDKCTAELNKYLSTEPLLLGKMEERNLFTITPFSGGRCMMGNFLCYKS
jgi:hypothetical protein